MADLPVFTYQTRIHLQAPQNEALEAYAELYGKAERTLFAATETGIDAMDLKQEYLRLFGITARQFNAIRIGLKGIKSACFRAGVEVVEVNPAYSAGDWSMVIGTVK